jgi:hypothetical protein
MSDFLVMCSNEQMNAVYAHVHWENAHFTYLRVLVWTCAHMCTMCVSLTCALTRLWTLHSSTVNVSLWIKELSVYMWLKAHGRRTDGRAIDRGKWTVSILFSNYSLDTKTTRQTKYMIVRTSFISLSDPTPCGTDGACSREGPNGGVLGESKFGATPCICRVATGHILPHNFAALQRRQWWSLGTINATTSRPRKGAGIDSCTCRL